MSEKRRSPSMDDWLKEVKNDPLALEDGMILVHNGIVRKTPKAKVRQGIDEGKEVTRMTFDYDPEKVNEVIEATKALEGISHVKIWLNKGLLEVGEDIMYVLVAGDIRPHVIDALQYCVGKIKNECVVEVEQF